MVIEMEYRLGNSKYVKSRGETTEITCPNCNKNVNFGVFSNFERKLDVKSLIGCTSVYFLICPECSSVFTVDEANGDKFKKGDKSSIGADDLKLLTEFNKN